MNKCRRSTILRFFREESAATAVEYAVMLAVIILACIGAILSTGDVQRALFQNNVDAMNEHMFPQ